MSDILKVRIENQIAFLTINRPPYNPLNLDLIDCLTQELHHIEQNKDVHVLVISGEGEKAFCAGADINGFVSRLGTKDRSLIRAFHHAFNQLSTLSIPVIGALKGHVLGAGLELALACDFRICEEDAKLGLPEVNLGIFPGAGGTQRLPRIVGQAKALEMIMFGKTVSAKEAGEMCLVNVVVPKGAAESTAREWAEELKEKSKPVLARIKQSVQSGMQLPLHEGMELEQEIFSDLFLLDDTREGIHAFIEKRKAEFKHS